MRRKGVYTLRPLTAQEWAALTPVRAGQHRAQLTVAGKIHYLAMHPTREAAEAELAEALADFAEWGERYPYLPAVSGSEIISGESRS